MHARSDGFTLLEAIVALAILAAGTMALFAALNGALRSIERAEAAVRLDSATENALAFLESINPTTRPEGDEPLGAYRVRWRASLVAAPSEALTSYFHPGLHEVALYDLDVELRRGAALERRFVVRRAGWRQVRQPEVL